MQPSHHVDVKVISVSLHINLCFKEIKSRFHCLVVSDLLPSFPE